MFGINSQAVSQDTGVVSNYGAEPALGGDPLQPAEVTPTIPSPVPPAMDHPLANPVHTLQQADTTSAPALGANDDLIELKKDALQKLTPLVGHLDQTPEEKFRTTMMLIQATDDKSLLKSAYQAALQISDEKSRAQALLDVVNEINYFTHPDAQ